ncbi:hypothetical protein DdX_10929 [Ditylenchus destructor]|uniref:Uncharacterized protein n=1 Tax=Ditylenchus destructor TaxID=166010 RepID=A0AAD4MXM3_9BILA|nr:hypothetical protein DdX_10929 [Ditylenchus destructor]
MPSGYKSPPCVVQSRKFLCHSSYLIESYHYTSYAFGGGQDRQISTNALRAHNSDVGGPISNLTIFPSMAHREESFDVSHASGRMLDISKQ